MQLAGLKLEPGIKIELPPPPPSPYYVRTFGNNLTSPVGQFIPATHALGYDRSDNLYATGFGNYNNPGEFGATAKFNSDKTVAWQKSISTGNSSDSTDLKSVGCDNLNNVYVAGTVVKNWLSATKSSTFQVAKYNSSGAIQWQRDLGYGFTNSVPSFGSGLAVEKTTGNLYVTGDQLIGPTTGSQPALMTLIKYNTNGSIVWSKSIGTSNINNHSNAVALDTTGNVYIAGNTIVSSNNTAALVKYNSSGVLQWQVGLTSSVGGNTNQFNGIAIDRSNNIFVCGGTYFGSQLVGVIAKYNTSGTLIWQRKIFNTQAVRLDGISVDSLGNVYAVGLSGTGYQDGLIVKYNTDGILQWQRYVTGQSLSSDPALIILTSITFDSLDNMTVSGPLTLNQLRSNSDMIILKMPSDGTLTGTYSVNNCNITYAIDNNSEAALTYTPVVTTMYSAGVNYIDAGPSTLTDATSTFVDNITSIP
jgi:hypothetical protein